MRVKALQLGIEIIRETSCGRRRVVGSSGSRSEDEGLLSWWKGTSNFMNNVANHHIQDLDNLLGSWTRGSTRAYARKHNARGLEYLGENNSLSDSIVEW
jgi:hypothetical protein